MKLLELIGLFSASIFILKPSSTFSQVKIGDNPTTINANSILELESTNQGFLCPRVAINDVNSVSPLSGTVPAGMLVYNSSGTVDVGYYSWNGTKWLRLETTSDTRTNYKLIKTQADFPTPVSGVINLIANTTYEINGTIILTNKINLNGCTVYGSDHLNDKLIYTPATGELFTGSNCGTLRMLTLTANTAGSQLFNIDALSTQKDLIVQNCIIGGCNTIGTIKNTTGFLMFSDMMCAYNTNGITFQNTARVHMNNVYWQNNNWNTYVTFIGAFDGIRITGGSCQVLAAQSAKVLDISGITSLLIGDLKNVLFAGDGTYVLGTISGAWEVEANGLRSQKDDLATGNMYLTTTQAVTFTATDTPVKVLGTTVPVNLFRVSSPTNNKLVYEGTKTRYCHVLASISVSSTAANKNFSFYIAKNGVILPESVQMLRLASAVDKGSLTVSCNVEMSTNDYIEIYVENNSDLSSMTALSMNVLLQ